MSMDDALQGDLRSCQIMVAIFVDAFPPDEGIPCLAIAVCTINILFKQAFLFSRKQETDHLRTEIRRLRRLYPDVFRCSLQFLAGHHTEEQRAHISAVKNTYDCRCLIEPDTFLAKMHTVKSLSDALYANSESSLGREFLESLGCVLTCFYESVSGSGGLFRLFRRRERSRNTTSWPQLPTDLYPFGVHETLVNIAAWITHAPTRVLLELVENTYDSVACPSYHTVLLSTTRVALVSILNYALASCERLEGQPRPDTKVIDLLVAVGSRARYILNLSKECFVGVRSHNDLAAWKVFVRLMFRASDVIDHLQQMPALQEDHSDLADASQIIAICALRFASIFQQPVYGPGARAKLMIFGGSVHGIRRTRDCFSGLWYFLQFVYPLNTQGPLCVNSLCAHTKCETTKLSQCGRNLRICSGCNSIYYCSRVCQKAAWRHDPHPHRTVCNGLRILSEVILEHPDVYTSAERFIEICPGGKLDEPLATALGHYLAGIYSS